MTTAGVALSGLRRQRPEWAPWLAVVEEVLRESANPEWSGAVPALGVRSATAPLLAHASLSLKASAIRRMLERLIRTASRGDGTGKMRGVQRVLDTGVEVLPLFAASVCQDSRHIAGVADASGVDGDAWRAVVSLLPVPFLRACRDRWANSSPTGWTEGYCPVCASWPAFAEVRGIERRRYFRCGRCGGQWQARVLNCPYCGMCDHDEFVSLVPENGASRAVVDACRRCLAYVKTFTRLQGCAPDAVMLEDLASVDLDVAAIGQGYTRPSGAGYALDIGVIDGGGDRRRMFAWKS